MTVMPDLFDWLNLVKHKPLYTTFYHITLSNISNTRDGVSSGYPNTEKRVENTTHSGVFLTKFKVFG